MAELAQVLRPLLPVEDPNVLVDASTGDDAAVYDLGDGRALVVTVDFFTPLVDDPYDFGRIAAANALSDIYAMGSRPLFALNLLGFPRDLLHEGLVEEILRGGAAVARNAGVPILGGHTVDDVEPKYGLVVVGEVERERLVSNSGARPGDALVLTKPLGTGIIATAIKAGAASGEVAEAAVHSMTALNRSAADAMTATGVSAATDVTGYGLLGHLRNLLRQSGVGADVYVDDVPELEGARALAEAGHIPGGTKRNLEDVTPDVDFGDAGELDQLLLADAQTSGGLLIAVAPEKLEELLDRLDGKTLARAVVGRVIDAPAGMIHLH